MESTSASQAPAGTAADPASSAQAPDIADAADAATVDVSGLWKIFGKRTRAAKELAAQGRSREEIRDETDCLIAVRDVSFRVSAGETFVVMGLSGSGKSTLVRCVSRLIEPTAGDVTVCGTALADVSDAGLRDLRRQKMAMVFQHFGLFPHRRVLDNVAYGLEVQGISRDERHERALSVLDTVGLSGWGDHFPQQLSGGMQQRVGLARALAVEPEVLFFDEPFSALDPLIRRDMQDELVALQQELQRTIVFITHDFAEALRLADRIAIMSDGVFTQVGTPLEILTEPANDYVKAFTQDAPIAKVLQACSLMRPLGDTIPDPLWPRLADTASLETALPDLLSEDRPVVICNRTGEPVGLLHGDDVAAVLEQNLR